MKSTNGFTLVELLAAMLIGSLILVWLGYMSAGLGGALRSSDDAGGQLELASERLTALLQSARSEPASGVNFQMTTSHLQAVVAPPLALPGAGPLRLNLDVERQGGTSQLLARLSPTDRGDQIPEASRDAHVLISGARDIRFERARFASPVQPGGVPQIVHMVVIDRQGIDRLITIATRINGNGTCRFDPISQTCRY